MLGGEREFHWDTVFWEHINVSLEITVKLSTCSDIFVRT